MSSRAEEKARRRAEREEAERKAQAKASATRRLQIVGGVILGLALIAVAVVVVTGGGGDSKGPATSVANAVALPPVRETDLQAAAKTAGCKLLNPPDQGATHTDQLVTYKFNPPAGGPHNPVPAEDGRIEFQYRPGTPTKTIDQIETLASEPLNGSPGYHTLTLENNTKMPYAAVAIAWNHVLACDKMTSGYFDAARAFRKAYTDKGPEIVP